MSGFLKKRKVTPPRGRSGWYGRNPLPLSWATPCQPRCSLSPAPVPSPHAPVPEWRSVTVSDLANMAQNLGAGWAEFSRSWSPHPLGGGPWLKTSSHSEKISQSSRGELWCGHYPDAKSGPMCTEPPTQHDTTESVRTAYSGALHTPQIKT